MTTLSEHIYELFSELVQLPSPSGREAKTAAFIRTWLSNYGYEVQSDAAGNVFVHLAGQDPNLPLVCYAAHMDEIGFIITKIEPDGQLHAIRLGGLLPWKAGEGPVTILADDGSTITGVLSMGSTHTANAAHRHIDWTQVRIITGLTADELAHRGIAPGAAGVVSREVVGPIKFGPDNDPLIGAWTFDDRMGCVCQLEFLAYLQDKNIKPQSPTVVAFTTREEIGGLGAAFLANRLQPDLFISVDGAPIPTGAPLTIDDRPALWTKDRAGVYDHQLNLALIAAAANKNINIQRVAYESGASDASLVAQKGFAGKIACIGHARHNSHGYEVTRLSVFPNIVHTLVEFATSWPLGLTA